MTEAEIETTVANILRRKFGSFGLDRVELEIKPDQDDEESIFVHAFFKPGFGTAPAQAAMDVSYEVHEAVRRSGDARWTYVRHHYVDDEVAVN